MFSAKTSRRVELAGESFHVAAAAVITQESVDALDGYLRLLGDGFCGLGSSADGLKHAPCLRRAAFCRPRIGFDRKRVRAGVLLRALRVREELVASRAGVRDDPPDSLHRTPSVRQAHMNGSRRSRA